MSELKQGKGSCQWVKHAYIHICCCTPEFKEDFFSSVSSGVSTEGTLISAPAVRVGRAGVGGVEGEAYKSSPMDTVLYSLRRVDNA